MGPVSSPDEDSVGVVETQRARVFDDASPLTLRSGATLAPVDVAYGGT